MEPLDSLPCPVLVTDRKGGILATNRDMVALIGKTAEAWVTQPMDTLFPRSAQIFLQTHVWPMLLRDDRVDEMFLPLLDVSGQRVPILVNCQKSRLNGADCYHWVFFVARERSRFEAELLQARRDSEQMTAKLAHANAELETLHRALSNRAHTLELANYELAKLSYSDPLTGLANRRAMAKAIQNWQAMETADAYASLLIVDVDFFKAVNDQHGHDEGNRILILLAQQLESSIREQDLAIRYGGEEFALWLPSTDRDGAEHTAQRVHDSVRELQVAGKPITVSIGAATAAYIKGPELMHRLIEQADKAVYRAKSLGRNQTQHYRQPDTVSVLYAKVPKRG